MELGTDTYIVVSPSQNTLITCEPEAVNQILRGKGFDKPAELIKLLNVFGPTITGAENKEGTPL